MESLKPCRCFSSLTLSVLVVLTVTIATSTAAQNTSSIRLLPTGRESARVRVLEDTLQKHPPEDVRPLYAELKGIVQDFVTRQLDAAPAISDLTLHDQLRRVIGRIENDDGEEALYVRSAPNDWGPRSNQRVWVVAYAIPEGVGTSGVIDCYVRADGRTRLAGRQDADLFLYSLHVDWLDGGPYQIGLLANGRLAGSNGLGGWTAAVGVRA